jgi:hypothetical protein
MKMNYEYYDEDKQASKLYTEPMITQENYYQDKTHITNSMLSRMSDNKALFSLWLKGEYEYPRNPNFEFGDLIHKMILEPDKVHQEFFFSEANDKRTKAFLFDKEDNPDKLVFSASEYQQALSMANSVKSKKFWKNYVHADVEQIATGEVFGVDAKCKADIVKHTDYGIELCDIKTTSGTLDEFKWNAKKYGYHRQAAMYMKLFNAQQFGFIVVEKNFPYSVGYFYCSEDFIDMGNERLQDDIANYIDDFMLGGYDSDELRSFEL